MAPDKTARKVIGTGTSTKTSAEKELLKLGRAKRAEARRVKRVKAEEDKDTGNAARPKGSRGARGRGRRGSRGGPVRGVLPEPNNFEEIEEKMSNREFSEDEINLEEICQCEGIPGREPENDTFDVNFYIDAYSL